MAAPLNATGDSVKGLVQSGTLGTPLNDNDESNFTFTTDRQLRVSNGSSPSSPTFTVDSPLTPLGYRQFTVSSAGPAQNLPTIPPGALFALIQVETQNTRWRDDGTSPTAAVGFPLLTDTPFWVPGVPSTFQIIGTNAIASVVNVSYYS